MNPEGKITIKDVARLSGLSKGTVDRVIHNRGEVSKKSYDKVMKVVTCTEQNKAEIERSLNDTENDLWYYRKEQK